jgi:hypothetical protein
MSGNATSWCFDRPSAGYRSFRGSSFFDHFGSDIKIGCLDFSDTPSAQANVDYYARGFRVARTK